MQIRYVVSSMVFWGREHPLSFEQECQFLQSLGFGIELWPNIKGQNECRYERRNWPRLAAATSDMLVAMRSRYDSPTLEQWAELTGLSVNFLFRFQHGKIVLLDVKKLEILCKVLYCTPNDLLWSDEQGV